MDIDMPVINGIEATQQLLKKEPELKVAMLTIHDERAIIEKMLNIGVSGYFLKNADQSEFLSGIDIMLTGKKFFHSEAVMGLSRQSKRLSTGQANLALLSLLSDQEKEILRLIAEGKTSKEMGEALFISERTVETHRRNIHNKLEIKNLAGLVRFAVENGLLN